MECYDERLNSSGIHFSFSIASANQQYTLSYKDPNPNPNTIHNHNPEALDLFQQVNIKQPYSVIIPQLRRI
jgi:hypothetical protein